VPALLNREAELTLARRARRRSSTCASGRVASRYSGRVSGEQRLAAAFPTHAPQLRDAFNAYLRELKADGRYDALVDKYYPGIRRYFPNFFTER